MQIKNQIDNIFSFQFYTAISFKINIEIEI